MRSVRAWKFMGRPEGGRRAGCERVDSEAANAGLLPRVLRGVTAKAAHREATGFGHSQATRPLDLGGRGVEGTPARCRDAIPQVVVADIIRLGSRRLVALASRRLLFTPTSQISVCVEGARPLASPEDLQLARVVDAVVRQPVVVGEARQVDVD